MHPDFQWRLYVFLSFMMAFVLTIIPWANAWSLMQPPWVLLVLIFWLIRLPHQVGVMTAWAVGFVLDLLLNCTLGQHALLFSILAFLIIQFRVAINGLPMWQQGLLIFVILLMYLLVQYWLMMLLGINSVRIWYWISMLTGALVWPWLYELLDGYQKQWGWE